MANMNTIEFKMLSTGQNLIMLQNQLAFKMQVAIALNSRTQMIEIMNSEKELAKRIKEFEELTK